MIDIRAVVRSILLSDPAISAMVGGVRVYPDKLPQGIILPSVVQNAITETLGYHMQGDDGLMDSRIQISALSKNTDEATRLGGLIFEKLSGYRGVTPYGSASPQLICEVKGVFHDQGRSEYDPASEFYSRQRDYLFWYRVR